MWVWIIDIQITIECGFTLKHVHDMIRTYSPINLFLGISWINVLSCPCEWQILNDYAATLQYYRQGKHLKILIRKVWIVTLWSKIASSLWNTHQWHDHMTNRHHLSRNKFRLNTMFRSWDTKEVQLSSLNTLHIIMNPKTLKIW